MKLIKFIIPVVTLIIILNQCTPSKKNDAPYYYGYWYFIVEDSTYREFYLDDNYLILPNDSSVEFFKQDIIDDIIYFTDNTTGEPSRIFYAKPNYINDTTMYLTGDVFEIFRYTAHKIDSVKFQTDKTLVDREKLKIDFNTRKKNRLNNNKPQPLND